MKYILFALLPLLLLFLIVFFRMMALSRPYDEWVSAQRKRRKKNKQAH